jgi:hypothetical protein
MTQRTTIVGNRAVFSETAVLEAIGTELLAIKSADKLSWDDVAAVLGVSDVQAAKYVDGSAKMHIVTYARAKREWNGRFTGALDRLCEETRPGTISDRSAQCSVLKAALAMSEALEGDEEIVREEVRRNRQTLENARDAIEAQLAKLVRAA